LIRKHDVTHVDESTVFWFNLGVGLSIAFILCVCAPWIASFYEQPVLNHLVMLMAANMVISAASSVHSTLLTKRLAFKINMKIGVTSVFLSGTMCIYLAWSGYGVWALAARILMGNIVLTVLRWIYSQWSPLFVFSRESLRTLFGFGGYLFAAGILAALYNQGYTLLIGKFYGVRDLGMYNRAEGAQQLPVGVITSVLSGIAFPLFSAVNRDSIQLRKGVRLSIRSLTWVTVPMMLGMAVLAEHFIQVVFGDQWGSATPILQVLCFAGLLHPLDVINVTVLKAQGHANLFFRIEVIKKCIGIIFLGIGSFFGVMGIAYSVVFLSLASFMINTYYTKIHLNYGATEQFLDCFPSLVLGVFMTVFVGLIGSYYNSGILNLIGLITFGAVFYIAGSMVFRLGAYEDIMKIMKKRV